MPELFRIFFIYKYIFIFKNVNLIGGQLTEPTTKTCQLAHKISYPNLYNLIRKNQQNQKDNKYLLLLFNKLNFYFKYILPLRIFCYVEMYLFISIEYKNKKEKLYTYGHIRS